MEQNIFLKTVFLPRQRSTAFRGAEHHDLNGFLPGHSSSAFRGAEHHDLDGFLPRPSSTARGGRVQQRIVELIITLLQRRWLITHVTCVGSTWWFFVKCSGSVTTLSSSKVKFGVFMLIRPGTSSTSGGMVVEASLACVTWQEWFWRVRSSFCHAVRGERHGELGFFCLLRGERGAGEFGLTQWQAEQSMGVLCDLGVLAGRARGMVCKTTQVGLERWAFAEKNAMCIEDRYSLQRNQLYLLGRAAQ